MLTINLEDSLKRKLQKEAENNGRTLEQEITAILNYHLIANFVNSSNLADRIKQRFRDLDNVEIAEISRDKIRTLPILNQVNLFPLI